MATATALNGQTLFDIALQHCGAAEAAYQIALLNGIDITAVLTPGQELQLPPVVNAQVVGRYRQDGIKPATEVIEEPCAETYEVFQTIPYTVHSLIYYNNSHILFSAKNGSSFDLYKYQNGEYTRLIEANANLYAIWGFGARLFSCGYGTFCEINTESWVINTLFTRPDTRFTPSFVSWNGTPLMCYLGEIYEVGLFDTPIVRSSSYSFLCNLDDRCTGSLLSWTTDSGVDTWNGITRTSIPENGLDFSPFSRSLWYTILGDKKYIVHHYKLYCYSSTDDIWEQVELPTSEDVMFIGAFRGELHIATRNYIYKLNGYAMYYNTENCRGGHGVGAVPNPRFITMKGRTYMWRNDEILIHSSYL